MSLKDILSAAAVASRREELRSDILEAVSSLGIEITPIIALRHVLLLKQANRRYIRWARMCIKAFLDEVDGPPYHLPLTDAFHSALAAVACTTVLHEGGTLGQRCYLEALRLLASIEDRGADWNELRDLLGCEEADDLLNVPSSANFPLPEEWEGRIVAQMRKSTKKISDLLLARAPSSATGS